MIRMAQKARFRVEIVIVALGYTGPTHEFASRAKAERFARAISNYLPAARSGEVSPAWALIYALPSGITGCPSGHCYMALDAKESLVKRHTILPGHYGAPRASGEAHHA